LTPINVGHPVLPLDAEVREQAMILYHFTPMDRVEAIKRDGLRAKLQAMLNSSTMLGTYYKPAVYLTDKPTTAETATGMELYRQLSTEVPIASKRWLRFDTDEPLARFTIRLPSHDRKLKQYGPWLRANYYRIDGLPDPDIANLYLKRAMNEWWLYFGDIAPSMIVDCLVEEAIPYRPAAAPHLR
jgi:hypothetical protein